MYFCTKIFCVEMLKIAVPVHGDFISENFDLCSYYLIYEIENKKIVGKKVEIFSRSFQKRLIDCPEDLGITDIIVHRLDSDSLSKFVATKINLFVGVKIMPPDLLVEEYLNGALQSDTHCITEN